MANTKTLFSLLAVAAVGGFAYVYFRNQCQGAGYASYPTICGWLGVAAPAAAATTAGNVPVATLPVATTPTAPVTSSLPVVPAPAASSPPPTPASAWQAAIAGMKAQAGTNSLTFDQWSYYFQNAPATPGTPTGYGQSGSISPNLFGAIVALGGGNNNQQITAEQFIGYYQQALANAGLSGFEIPAWLIHRGAYA